MQFRYSGSPQWRENTEASVEDAPLKLFSYLIYNSIFMGRGRWNCCSCLSDEGRCTLKDETGVYKNLLQEIAQRVGAPLPLYTTFRSGLGHLPVFTCTVELAGITFTGEPAKNKKQAEKNAAMAAWSSLKQLAKQAASSSSETEMNNDEQEQITIARALLNYRLREKMALATANTPNALPFPKRIPMQDPKPSVSQPQPTTGSKILPLIRPKSTPRTKPTHANTGDGSPYSAAFLPRESRGSRQHKFPAAGAAPYVPVRHYRGPYHGVAPPVTIRTAVPAYSAPLPGHCSQVIVSAMPIAPQVHIRPAVPVFAAPPPVMRLEEPPPLFVGHLPSVRPSVKIEEMGNPAVRMEEPSKVFVGPPPLVRSSVKIEEIGNASGNDLKDSVVKNMKQLKI